MTTSNKYKTLSKALFDKAVVEEKKPAVLVFGADWSGNSEIMDSMMGRVSQEFGESLQFFKINIEKQKAIAQLMGVTSVPTIVFWKDGAMINSIKGFISANKMRQKIRTVYLEEEEE